MHTVGKEKPSINGNAWTEPLPCPSGVVSSNQVSEGERGGFENLSAFGNRPVTTTSPSGSFFSAYVCAAVADSTQSGRFCPPLSLSLSHPPNLT